MFEWLYKRKKLETKTSVSSRTFVFGGGQANFNNREYIVFAKEGYQQNVIVFDAINKIAKGIASIDFKVFEGEGDKKRPVKDNHPLVKLLAMPNPWQAGAEFFESVISYFLISGNTYIEKSYPFSGLETAIGPDSGEPTWLYSLRPDMMLIKVDKQGRIESYDFGVTQKIRYPVDESFKSNIMHMKTFHSLNSFYGLSPLEAAAFSVDQHNEAGRWNLALLQNGARPSGVLKINGDENGNGQLGDDEFNRLKEQFEEEYAHSRNAGRPLLLEGGLEWQEMGLNPKDMDFLNVKNTSARDIAKAFGVPPILLGLPGDATFNNMETAEIKLWENTILPLADSLLDNLNQHLSPLYGDNITITFDKNSIEALAPRRAKKAESLNRLNFLTANEKRAMFGVEPIAGGDELPEQRESTPGPRDVTKQRYIDKLCSDGMETTRAQKYANIAYADKSN